MKISLYRDIAKIHDLTPTFLDINGQDYNLYHRENDVLSQYDISVHPPPPGDYSRVKFKVYLQLDIWDNFENQGWVHNNWLENGDESMLIVSNAWDPNYSHPRLIYNDFLFNRTKAYYEDYPFCPDFKRWYYQGRDFYSVPRQDADLKSRVFLGPNKTWPESAHRKTKFRNRIFKRLLESEHLGHIGNCQVDPRFFLIPHGICPEIGSINELDQVENKQQLVRQSLTINRFGYSPPHDVYYQDTFISIYGETIEYGSTLAITEKTYDPLIKGHFILPYSCQGFIKFLIRKGFRLPSFIDYGYDDESDDHKRLEKYLIEVDRLLAMPLDVWQQYWVDNTDLRTANQKIFWDSPYDRVDLVQFVQNL